MMRVREWREARGRRETRRPMWRFAERGEGGGDRHAARALNLFEKDRARPGQRASKFRVRGVNRCSRSRQWRRQQQQPPRRPAPRRRSGRRGKPFFRKSGDEFLAAAEPLDADRRSARRTRRRRGDAHELGADEVKEMDRTNWLYETQDPQVAMRVKV